MSYPKIKPCPRCKSEHVSVYKYDSGWQYVECDGAGCWYRGPGEGSIKAAIKSHNESCGGVEVRHAQTGNMPGSVPGEEMSPPATSFERTAVQGAAIQPCAGVTTGPQDAVSLPLHHHREGQS